MTRPQISREDNAFTAPFSRILKMALDIRGAQNVTCPLQTYLAGQRLGGDETELVIEWQGNHSVPDGVEIVGDASWIVARLELQRVFDGER